MPITVLLGRLPRCEQVILESIMEKYSHVIVNSILLRRVRCWLPIVIRLLRRLGSRRAMAVALLTECEVGIS